jgi:hypothetical protein
MQRDKRVPVELIELHPIARRGMFTAAFSITLMGRHSGFGPDMGK